VGQSDSLLTVVDVLAGPARRSAWIEAAVRRYAHRELRRQRRLGELELLNRHADALNAGVAAGMAIHSDPGASWS
jgi:hypothetical protein